MTKTPTSAQDAPTTPPQVRARLAEALNLDLVLAFQAEIEGSGELAFVPRPNLRWAWEELANAAFFRS